MLKRRHRLLSQFEIALGLASWIRTGTPLPSGIDCREERARRLPPVAVVLDNRGQGRDDFRSGLAAETRYGLQAEPGVVVGLRDRDQQFQGLGLPAVRQRRDSAFADARIGVARRLPSSRYPVARARDRRRRASRMFSGCSGARKRSSASSAAGSACIAIACKRAARRRPRAPQPARSAGRRSAPAGRRSASAPARRRRRSRSSARGCGCGSARCSPRGTG